MFYNALLIAFATYSRIPVPQADWNEKNRKYSMCFFPLVGMVIGGAIALWIWLCCVLDIPELIKGAVCAALPILISGGIHMDGFMDTQDAMASWQPMEKRLEILKDTHTGAFAVINCSLYLIINTAFASRLSINEIPQIFCIYTVSRALSSITLTLFKSARPGGMLDSFARSAHKRTVTAFCSAYLAVSTVILLSSGFFIGIMCICASLLLTLFYRYRAYKYFGGITGDLAGWFVQIEELLMLAVIIFGRILI